MAVIGDTSKFISMADKRIASVTDDSKSVTVSVTGTGEFSPIVSGYSSNSPIAVKTDGFEIERQSSLDRLSRAKSGWFLDYQTKQWHAKLDFGSRPSVIVASVDLTSANRARIVRKRR